MVLIIIMILLAQGRIQGGAIAPPPKTFRRRLFCHSSVVQYTSCLLQWLTRNENWLPNITEIPPPNWALSGSAPGSTLVRPSTHRQICVVRGNFAGKCVIFVVSSLFCSFQVYVLTKVKRFLTRPFFRLNQERPSSLWDRTMVFQTVAFEAAWRWEREKPNILTKLFYSLFARARKRVRNKIRIEKKESNRWQRIAACKYRQSLAKETIETRGAVLPTRNKNVTWPSLSPLPKLHSAGGWQAIANTYSTFSSRWNKLYCCARVWWAFRPLATEAKCEIRVEKRAGMWQRERKVNRERRNNHNRRAGIKTATVSGFSDVVERSNGDGEGNTREKRVWGQIGKKSARFHFLYKKKTKTKQYPGTSDAWKIRHARTEKRGSDATNRKPQKLWNKTKSRARTNVRNALHQVTTIVQTSGFQLGGRDSPVGSWTIYERATGRYFMCTAVLYLVLFGF